MRVGCYGFLHKLDNIYDDNAWKLGESIKQLYVFNCVPEFHGHRQDFISRLVMNSDVKSTM